MAIVNRDLDPSQQRWTFQQMINSTASGISVGFMNPGIATGFTYVICNIPCSSQLVAADESVYGLSGAPVHSLWIYRFAGGFTAIAIGQSQAATAFGTSGIQGFSLFGASWLLQAGDQLVLYTQGANTAVAAATVTCVVKALQDIRTDFGV